MPGEGARATVRLGGGVGGRRRLLRPGRSRWKCGRRDWASGWPAGRGGNRHWPGRLAVLAVFYVVELANYALGGVGLRIHEQISLLVAAWGGAVDPLSTIPRKPPLVDPRPIRLGPARLALLLAILRIADGVNSPLLVGYPLVIVASGLWFRVRFVWFITVLSLASYGVLVVDFYRWRPWLQVQFNPGVNRHVIFAVALVVLGSVVAYLVQRVRALSNFCGRPLP